MVSSVYSAFPPACALALACGGQSARPENAPLSPLLCSSRFLAPPAPPPAPLPAGGTWGSVGGRARPSDLGSVWLPRCIVQTASPASLIEAHGGSMAGPQSRGDKRGGDRLFPTSPSTPAPARCPPPVSLRCHSLLPEGIPRSLSTVARVIVVRTTHNGASRRGPTPSAIVSLAARGDVCAVRLLAPLATRFAVAVAITSPAAPRRPPSPPPPRRPWRHRRPAGGAAGAPRACTCRAARCPRA